MELLHNVQHCSQALMYTLHTCFSCKWYLLSFLMCAFSSTICCWRLSASLKHGQTSVGEGEEWVRGGRSTLALVRQKYYRCYALMQRLQSGRLSKHALVRGSGSIPLEKLWKLGSLRVHLLAIHISAQFSRVCSQMSITAHELCHQTCTKSKQQLANYRCGTSCMDIPHPSPLRR